MSFVGMNYTAILIAAVAGFAFGGAWYGIFGKVWMKAAGIDCDGNKQAIVPMVLAGIANIILAFTLAGLMAHMVVDLFHGVISAAIVWAGFILPTTVVNYSFQMRPLLLTIIDTAHWLLVLVIMGAIIGYMGV